MPHIAVIGAGVVGLSTAINILQRTPSAKVTIIADKFNEETTSSGAGGLFRPNVMHAPGSSPHSVKRWAQRSWEHYAKMALSDLSEVTGHSVTSGYIFSHTKIENPLYKEIVFNTREMPREELDNLNMHQYEYGYEVTSIITNMKRYLPWLMSRFKDLGGTFIKRKIQNFDELVGHYDVVVNCAALGNRELGDKSMFPVRGHLIQVAAPWIKHWIYTDEGAYIIPNSDVINIGGIRQKDNYSMEVDKKETEGILERCFKLWPALKGAKVVSEWIGLRPTRSPIRLEKEVKRLPTGDLKIVHNYGHGANGVTLSWGTSVEATEMVEDLLRVQQPQAKL